MNFSQVQEQSALDEVKNHSTINWGDPDDPAEESSFEKGRLISQEVFNTSDTRSSGTYESL